MQAHPAAVNTPLTVRDGVRGRTGATIGGHLHSTSGDTETTSSQRAGDLRIRAVDSESTSAASRDGHW